MSYIWLALADILGVIIGLALANLVWYLLNKLQRKINR